MSGRVFYLVRGSFLLIFPMRNNKSETISNQVIKVTEVKAACRTSEIVSSGGELPWRFKYSIRLKKETTAISAPSKFYHCSGCFFIFDAFEVFKIVKIFKVFEVFCYFWLLFLNLHIWQTLY